MEIPNSFNLKIKIPDIFFENLEDADSEIPIQGPISHYPRMRAQHEMVMRGQAWHGWIDLSVKGQKRQGRKTTRMGRTIITVVWV
jgi:hypothetical protein